MICIIKSEQPRFFVFIENEIVQNDINNFAEAVMFFFMYHYILNVKFAAPGTLEFCQRAFVQAGWSDNHGAKASRRVNTLLKTLNLL